MSSYLNVQVLTPNEQTVAFNGNFMSPTQNINLFGGGSLLLDIENARVALVNTTGASVAFQAPVVVIKITDLTARPIGNVQVGTFPNLGNIQLRPQALISGNNFLQFDLVGAMVPPRSVLLLDIGFLSGEPSPVPLPASLPVFVSGLMALASVRFAAKGRRPVL